MNREERRNLAIDTVDSIIANIEKSVQKAVAIFGDENEALDKIIIPEVRNSIKGIGGRASLLLSQYSIEKEMVYTGEHRNLQKLFGCNDDYAETFIMLHDLIHRGGAQDIKPGDYIRIPVKVPACEIEGMSFEELNIPAAESVVTDVIDGKVIFQFEEVLFHSAINEDNTNKGGFAKSTLCAYLNDAFMTIFGRVKDFMALNKYGNRIALPTNFEVFGEGSDKSMNWLDSPRQLDYFKSIKNRIRVKDNDTTWWWLSTPYSAASAYFCLVGGNGLANYYGASASGGAAPAFCIS
jgi:hypothetical protein